ncbi:MAG TPA: PilZ domain-containing protein [Candidatus Acidoferrum sp.]|nr:PilZ domain-containing protein [Candidatus Acidoferrum sp.]
MHRSRYPERRRTVRMTLQIPLKIQCQMPEGEVIDLKAFTQFVSAHGALIVMDVPLLPGQTVRVFNEMTSESVECFVTSVREKQDRRFIGVGFSSPKNDFWHVVFPKAGTRQAVRSSQTGSLIKPGKPSNIPPQN